MMTEEQIREIEATSKSRFPIAMEDMEHAYRLGWEARGKRDVEVCREHGTSTSKGLYEQGYTTAAFACALAIARDGKA